MTRYGHAFASLFPDEATIDEAKRDWSRELGDMNIEQIKFAIDNMGKEHTDWPPNLPQFRRLCKAWQPPYRPQLPKPRTEADEESALSAIEQLKKSLGVPNDSI